MLYNIDTSNCTVFWFLVFEDHVLSNVLILNKALREPAIILYMSSSKWSTITFKMTYRAISFCALSTESDPWQMLRPTARAKSPRIVPVRQRASSTHSQGTCSEFWTHTRSRRERVGRAEHGAASLDGIETLPDHANDGAGGHVLDEAGEEGLALEVSVVYIVSRSGYTAGVGLRLNNIRFSRCSGVAWTSLRAMSLKPRFSKREMMSPTMPRWTPSG